MHPFNDKIKSELNFLSIEVATARNEFLSMYKLLNNRFAYPSNNNYVILYIRHNEPKEAKCLNLFIVNHGLLNFSTLQAI